MLFGAGSRRILAYREPIDMRKSFDGLIAVTKQVLGEDPLSGHWFVFANRRGNMLKILMWDRTGFCLYAKRLERGHFYFPGSGHKQEISEEVLKLILDGVSLVARAQR